MVSHFHPNKIHLRMIYIAGSGLRSLLELGFLYYTNTMGKGSESGSKPMRKVSAQYYAAIGFGIRVRIRIRQCKSAIRRFGNLVVRKYIWTSFMSHFCFNFINILIQRASRTLVRKTHSEWSQVKEPWSLSLLTCPIVKRRLKSSSLPSK